MWPYSIWCRSFSLEIDFCFSFLKSFDLPSMDILLQYRWFRIEYKKYWLLRDIRIEEDTSFSILYLLNAQQETIVWLIKSFGLLSVSFCLYMFVQWSLNKYEQLYIIIKRKRVVFVLFCLFKHRHTYIYIYVWSALLNGNRWWW